MNRSGNGNGSVRKRPPQTPVAQQQPPAKHQATTEDEDIDEEVVTVHDFDFEEESLILRDMAEQEALSSRLGIWTRPALSQAYLSQSQSVVFQQLEIDYVIGDSHPQLLPTSSGQAAIIRIFGVTKEGHSVCCHVHGFEPYFYINCPSGMGPDDIYQFHLILEANRNSKVPRFVQSIEMVRKRSIMYYQQQDSQPFLKIVVALPTMVASCRGILDKGIQIDGSGMKSFMTYESNVLFALRFMIDCNVVGGNWIDVPAGKYKKTTRSMSYCQLEVDCLCLWLNKYLRYSNFISHPAEGEFSKMAPFCILSYHHFYIIGFVFLRTIH